MPQIVKIQAKPQAELRWEINLPYIPLPQKRERADLTEFSVRMQTEFAVRRTDFRAVLSPKHLRVRNPPLWVKNPLQKVESTDINRNFYEALLQQKQGQNLKVQKRLKSLQMKGKRANCGKVYFLNS